LYLVDEQFQPALVRPAGALHQHLAARLDHDPLRALQGVPML
jgi:hypothetical protein